MMDFLKKQRVSFYMMIAAAVLALVGWILFLVSNSVQSYHMTDAGWIIFAGVAAIVLIGVGAWTSSKFGSQIWVTAILLVAVVLVSVSFGFTIANRVNVAGALFSFDSGNKLAAEALSTGIVSVVFNLLAAITLAVTAFLKQGAKD